MGGGTSGDGGEQEPTEPEQDSVDPDTLWGWFDSIANWFESLWESIKALPSQIGEIILNGIKEIFVPDTEVIQQQFDDCIENITRSLGLQLDSLDFLKDSITEKPIPDESADYNIPGVGNFNLTFFDASFLRQGVDYFRPLIRGFVVLLLIFFSYRAILTFLGFDPGILGNASGDSAGLKTDKDKGGNKS